MRLIFASVMVLFACSASFAPSIAASKRSIPIFLGHIDKSNYKSFLSLIAKNRDKVVGLKVTIRKTEDNDDYIGSEEKEYFLVSVIGDVKPNAEVLINSGHYDHGDFVADGFYLIKSGGVHQGTSSYGLRPVDEAQVRLNADVSFTEVAVR